MKNIIHIIPSEFSATRLKDSFSINEDLRGEILPLCDSLSVGPVTNLDTNEGQGIREEWLRKNIFEENAPYAEERLGLWMKDHFKIQSLNQKLKDSNLCIWLGKNIFDQLMLCRLMYMLRPSTEDIYIIPISEIEVEFRSGRVFKPETINILVSNQIALLAKYKRHINQQEIDSAIVCWENMLLDMFLIRTLADNGNVIPQPENYFDDALLANCKEVFQHPARIIGNTMIKIDFGTGDFTLNWRLKELVRQNRLESEGTLNAMRDYKVSLKI